MPFTLAHPAAILPFLRQPFVPIALVAGAMAPDLPYFAMVSSTSTAWYANVLNGANSHDFAQILSVGLPLSLILAAILWLVVKPLRWALPESWVPQKPVFKGRPPTSARVALWTFYSLMVGLLTHLVWDSVTHTNGWVVTRVPLLASEPFAGIAVYRLLQHGSTLAGLVILLVWYLKRRKNSDDLDKETVPARKKRRTIFLILVVSIAAVTAAVSGLGSSTVLEDPIGAESFLWIIITRGGAALLVTLVCIAVVWHVVALIGLLSTLTRANNRP
ncbi:DUF4184 family protein [Paeniglutamicibacter sp. Y32M11]|uniref:DUF4184 family protein n=1 Tax=Paeniglutamicibacter sp. Y32M11 TaxID=2853258 RepID=UPI001C528998|nr:DUF4184 family protein [Paeniglutamicibacter sp. Y32M11]QXQ09806.1 DUF4184 family protein [Paeniglutamicibacter sp. Y32M11]